MTTFNDIGTAKKTPVMMKFISYQSLMLEWESHPDTAENMAEIDSCGRAFADRLAEIRREIVATPTTCAADFAAKLIVDTSYGEILPDWNDSESIWAEARALTSQIAA
ncbi:hypothetical protein [Paracoccus sp. S3-43]|uniref:hypothetical protein n=1 Tax=Paracoccus sp. S3-43 TaxID=3030011 RepID=UPI0023B1A99A|nr:hypothetical protein [Paracoccus sp. S3-43]WEF23412.1 hypothetical protein PXD02_11390 [Paracoccus sp. S3-43]